MHDSGSAYGRYFDRRFIAALLDAHVGGRADHSRALFALLMSDSWHDQHVERGTDVPQ
jgi:hypothetical protein